jgi:hypothetical protein
MGQAGDVRYDLIVSGTEIKVMRDNKPLDLTFSTTEEDGKTSASALHRFVESIGRSPVDAQMVCEKAKQGNSVHGVFGNK